MPAEEANTYQNSVQHCGPQNYQFTWPADIEKIESPIAKIHFFDSLRVWLYLTVSG
jgi:hypothetical protein